VSSARRGGKATCHWRFWEGGARGGTLNLMVGRGKGEGRACTRSMSRFHQLHPTDWRRPAVMHGYDLHTQDKYQSRHAEMSLPEPTPPPGSPETPPCTSPRGSTRGVPASLLHQKQNFASWLTLSNPTSVGDSLRGATLCQSLESANEGPRPPRKRGQQRELRVGGHDGGVVWQSVLL